MSEYKALTVNDVLTFIGEYVEDWDTIVHIDIGATNNYKVIKNLMARSGHLIIETGERGDISNERKNNSEY